MENKFDNLKTDVLFVVTRKTDEQAENENYIVHEIVFSTKNALCRFGEILSVMNGSEAFDLYDITNQEEPVLSRVCLEPLDDVDHPFTENIEEDLD